MTKDPFRHFVEEVSNICDKLKKLWSRVDELKALHNSSPTGDVQDGVYFMAGGSWDTELLCELQSLYLGICWLKMSMSMLYCRDLTSFIIKEEELCIGGRRVADAIVVSTVVLLTFVYQYLLGFIDRGGSKAGSSGPLDFRDIYISIDLFQAAYVWIKFRDVIPSIPRGAVYRRPSSNKWEPRIKFPVTRGVGGKSKRIPLGLYDSSAEAEVAYQIAAFYCKKRKHTGRLGLGGGTYFPIPALNVDASLPYEEQVNQVRDKSLKVYAEFEEASRNLPPCVPGPALEMTGEGELLTTSSFQQRRQPLNSRMDSLNPNIHNGVDFNNPDSVLPVFAKTQHELLEAYKEQIECLKAQVSGTKDENNMLKQRNSELEREKGLLEHQNVQLQSQLQSLPLLPELDWVDPFMSLSMEHEESLAR